MMVRMTEKTAVALKLPQNYLQRLGNVERNDCSETALKLL